MKKTASKGFNYLFVFLISFIISTPVLGQSGSIHFQITDKDSGKLIPARMIILKDGKPFHHKMESNLQLACRDNSIYTASGTGSTDLPEGTYEIWFGRGMEYSVDIKTVTVEADKKYYLDAKLIRELDTRGMVCGDMHLHTYTNSGHGDATIEERVISCAAEGLEWAVATDHNFVTDYDPYMKATGIKGQMATTASNEVSTQIGHFNTYPLKPGSKPVDHSITDGKHLFKHIRESAPKPVVIQINHPRWSTTDFFNIKGFHPYFGTTDHPEWSWDFDAIEVLNENYQLGWVIAPDNHESVRRDWFNLLNQNRRICGVGNSDSHTVTAAIAGVPRNYILSSTDIPAEIDEEELSANVKAQKVSVACGLLPTISVDNNYAMGAEFTTNDKPIRLQLKVQAASWVSCNKAELIKNGVVIKTFEIKNSDNPVRLDTYMDVKPEKDSWYLLIAYGDQPMFPMVGHLHKSVTPLGFTNPVWVDADGDGEINSIVHYSEKKIKELGRNVNQAVQILEQDPEIRPYILDELLHSDPGFAIKLIETQLSSASTDEKLLLYNELSKTDHPKAKALLKKLRKKASSPLEEITLEKHCLFPLHQNKMEQFKNRKGNKFFDKLSRLEKEFTYISTGARRPAFEIAYGGGGTYTWEQLTVGKNGMLNPGEKDHYDNPTVNIKRILFARKDTLVECYLNTNHNLTVSINGEGQSTIKANASEKLTQKLIKLPLAKGRNELVFQVKGYNPQFAFVELSNDLLLDPESEIIEIDHKARDKDVKYLTAYHDKYHGFGIALTDGLRGTGDWNSQLWQGWTGQNMEVILDLGKKHKIRNIKIGVLADQGSWIFLPKQIQFFSSNDGKNFQQIYQTSIDATKKLKNLTIKEYGESFKYLNARYIKVVATPINPLPEWHSAAGVDGAWIFVDEIIVE